MTTRPQTGDSADTEDEIVGLFRPYQQGETKTKNTSDRRVDEPAKVEQTSTPEPSAPSTSSARSTRRPKEGPTPTRAQAEAARRERLHPVLTPKEQRRHDRRARQDRRIAAMEAAENRPERALIRDYVDSRWTFSEFIMPIFLLVMAVWLGILIFAPRAIQVVNILSLVMLATLLGWAVDTWRLWRGVKKELDAKRPSSSRRGLLSYLNNRIMTPRRWRTPAPRVERGAHRHG
nr:DUF3043 domain-containing protein [Acidipropionibacterium timonense]